MPESRISSRRILILQKQKQALEMRMAGKRWQEIADALGYFSAQGPMLAVNAALRKTIKEPVDQMRALMLERFTGILQVFWPEMQRGNIKAAEICLETLEKMCRLFHLDTPTKIEVTGLDGGPIGLEVSMLHQRLERIIQVSTNNSLSSNTSMLEKKNYVGE